MMSEEQAQNLLYQLQMLESYYSDILQRESTLVNALREAAAAVDSIKGISETKESITLIPVGMGTFLKSKISSDDKILLNIGAGVAIEKDKDYASNFLESKIKEIEVALQDISVRKQQIEAQLEHGKEQMNQLMQGTNS